MLGAGSVVSVHVIDNGEDFSQACNALRSGTGPFAVDAERASGFTYSQRAYLIQVYRRDAGTFLFDPPAIGNMAELTEVAGDEEWIFHAASQDLPCLREVGITPRHVFDTELAARLLGMDRVGLGAVVSELLGVQLEKAHSAVDWSTRPLPEPWLEYAALDVELLVDLRDAMTVMLDEAGKTNYACQEFRATLDKPEKELAIEPWRRLSGLHTLRSTRLVAIARELWLARDRIAAQRDVAPGRLVPDASLVAAVAANPESKVALSKVKAFNGRASRSLIDEWWAAIERGRRTEDLPALRVKTTELPPARAWAERNPEAHERLLRMRPRMQAVSENHQIPIENLLTPALLRSVAWEPPPVVDEQHVATALLSGGARPWQVEICGPLIVDALLDESPLPVVDPPLEDHVSTE